MKSVDIDPRNVENKLIVKQGFYTGIGLALSAPAVAIIFKVVDALINAAFR